MYEMRKNKMAISLFLPNFVFLDFANKNIMASTFLSAAWRNLVMANYSVSPEILLPYLPKGTELDTWNGTHYVSLVGFMFENVRLLGLPIPFHTHFEEVNLRFYVRRKSGNEWKRAVVFIKEIVPKLMVSAVANVVYNEHYVTLPMSHIHKVANDTMNLEYAWKFAGNWNRFSVETAATPIAMADGSEAEFITEHYWGYTRVDAETTFEYEVGHPRWEVFPVKSYKIECELAGLYGDVFQEMLAQTPVSVLVAQGSDIVVKSRNKLIL